MDMDFIRTRITELRLSKGVSETAMSTALGHNRSYITHITSGRKNPSVPELLYIIEYLDRLVRFGMGEKGDFGSYCELKGVKSPFYIDSHRRNREMQIL